MKSDKLYIKLLGAAIWDSNGERLDVSGERLTEIIRLASFQGTGPLVFDQLLKLKDIDIPTALRMQMKQQCVQSILLQQSMIPLLSRAWNALTKVEIHPILLKGFGLAQFYPQPHLRQWGDIDLYVGQKQFDEACSVLRATFPTAIYPEVPKEECKHYNFDFPNTAIETHRISMEMHHPRDRKYYEQLEERYLTKDGPSFEIDGLTITTPEDTFNVFFTFLHAWHHFEGTGMNMKQVCDVAVLLHAKRETIDRARLQEMLTKLHLMEAWQLIMYIIVQYLGLSQEEAPLYSDQCKERAVLLFKRILKEGSSRHKEKINAAGASYIKRKWLTSQSRIAASREIKPYTPMYARHMIVSSIYHGFERTF